MLITSNADLAAACGRWSAARVIGVDTEFFRERTYYPLPALVQVADGDGVVIVDPLRISDFTPLAAVLADASIVKLIHACSEDLEVLELLTGAVPRGVLDTQLAGAFAGHGYSLGYRSLVKALMDVVLDKGETRSNWLGRPLSPTQLRYAALDVVYLLPMHRRLSQELSALGPWPCGLARRRARTPAPRADRGQTAGCGLPEGPAAGLLVPSQPCGAPSPQPVARDRSHGP